MRQKIIIFIVIILVMVIGLFYSGLKEYDNLVDASFEPRQNSKVLSYLTGGPFVYSDDNNQDYISSSTILSPFSFAYSHNYLYEDHYYFMSYHDDGLFSEPRISVDFDITEGDNITQYPCPLTSDLELDYDSDLFIPKCADFENDLSENHLLYETMYSDILDRLGSIDSKLYWKHNV